MGERKRRKALGLGPRHRHIDPHSLTPSDPEWDAFITGVAQPFVPTLIENGVTDGLPLTLATIERACAELGITPDAVADHVHDGALFYSPSQRRFLNFRDE